MLYEVITREVPGVHRARPRVSRPEVLGGLRKLSGAGQCRLHHQGARAAAARPGACDVPVQRLPVPPGAGDAAPPDGAAQHEHDGGGRIPVEAPERDLGSYNFV